MTSSTSSLPMKVPLNTNPIANHKILEWLAKHNPNLADIFSSDFQISVTRPFHNTNRPVVNTISQPGITVPSIPVTQNAKNAVDSIPTTSKLSTNPSLPPISNHQTTITNILHQYQGLSEEGQKEQER